LKEAKERIKALEKEKFMYIKENNDARELMAEMKRLMNSSVHRKDGQMLDATAREVV
jgi:hypothetical protein